MTVVRVALAILFATLAAGSAVRYCGCGGGGIFQINGIWQTPLDSDSDLFPFWRDGLAGFMNAAGIEVIPPQFRIWPQTFSGFREGMASVGSGYIDESGSLALPMNELKRPFSDGLARVRRSERTDNQYSSYFTYVDRAGNEAFRLENAADSADFTEGLAAFQLPTRWLDIDVEQRRFVAYPGAWGFVDKSGSIAIYPRFVDVGPFREGLARAMQDGYCYRPGFGDRRFASPTTGSSTCQFDAPELAKQPCLTGFIDRYGAFAIDPQFEAARDFADGLAAVRLNGLWGYVDKSGQMGIPPQFKSAMSFREGRAAVQTAIGWGFIDRDGIFAVAPRVGWVGTFNEGLAPVRADRRTFYIDKAGVERLSGPWTVAGSFVRGLAMVHFADGDWAYIDRKGETVLRFNPLSAPR